MNKHIAISLILLFFAFGFVGSQYYVVMHEVTHQTIFNNYGMKSEINIGLLKGETIGYGADKCDKFCELSNSMIEVVGYHIGILILNLWLITGLYLIIQIAIHYRRN